MIIRLFCCHCALAASKNLPHAPIDVPMPVVTIADDGRYEVRWSCASTEVISITPYSVGGAAGRPSLTR